MRARDGSVVDRGEVARTVEDISRRSWSALAAGLFIGLGLAACAGGEPAGSGSPGRGAPTAEPGGTASHDDRPVIGAWHSLVFDEARGEVLLVNGVPEDARDPRPLELWSWDGTDWSLLVADPRGPPGRNFAAVTYDSGRDVVVVHGGQSGGEIHGDTLEWDGGEWRVVAGEPGPGPRSAAAMAYDEASGLSVLYGGDNAGPVQGDTWTWDGTSWTQVAEPGPDPPRWPAMFAFDRARGQVVLYGGHQVVDPAAAPSVADTWVWDGTAWRLAEVGSPPGALVNAGGFYHPGLDRLVLVGGSDLAVVSGGAWIWTGATWDRLAADAFPARQGHGLAYDARRDVAVLTGGVVTPGQLERHQDLWEWSTTAPAVLRDGP